jgi:hypothetical protein
MTTSPEWTFNDGWILMSVFLTHGEDGACLDDVIGAADAMNHAIPTQGELSRSLTRLASCGVLSENGGPYRIADAYMPLIAKANSGKGGLFSTPDKGKNWLSRMRFDVDDTVRVAVTKEQLSKAFESYRKRLRRP